MKRASADGPPPPQPKLPCPPHERERGQQQQQQLRWWSVQGHGAICAAGTLASADVWVQVWLCCDASTQWALAAAAPFWAGLLCRRAAAPWRRAALLAAAAAGKRRRAQRHPAAGDAAAAVAAPCEEAGSACGANEEDCDEDDAPLVRWPRGHSWPVAALLHAVPRARGAALGALVDRCTALVERACAAASPHAIALRSVEAALSTLQQRQQRQRGAGELASAAGQFRFEPLASVPAAECADLPRGPAVVRGGAGQLALTGAVLRVRLCSCADLVHDLLLLRRLCVHCCPLVVGCECGCGARGAQRDGSARSSGGRRLCSATSPSGRCSAFCRCGTKRNGRTQCSE